MNALLESGVMCVNVIIPTHPQILGIGVGSGKVGLRSTKAVKSLTRSKVGRKL